MLIRHATYHSMSLKRRDIRSLVFSWFFEMLVFGVFLALFLSLEILRYFFLRKILTNLVLLFATNKFRPNSFSSSYSTYVCFYKLGIYIYIYTWNVRLILYIYIYKKAQSEVTNAYLKEQTEYIQDQINKKIGNLVEDKQSRIA